MAELLRCKSCGYVVEAGKVGDVCPACGVPRKMMEPYTDPVSQRRRYLLGFDLHPVIDHFSVCYATSALAVALFVLIFPEIFRLTATGVMRAFIGVLPLAVIASFLSGLFDGKVRFRRTTAPVLRTKKVVGALFFLFAAAAAVVTFAAGPFETWVRVLVVLLEAGGVACTFVPGRIGKGLLHALFPG